MWLLIKLLWRLYEQFINYLSLRKVSPIKKLSVACFLLRLSWREYPPWHIKISTTIWITIYTACVCVCVCVYVCVCVCVFIIFHLLVSTGCTTYVTYVRSSDQRSFVLSISRGFCQVPSSLFLNLSYFSSKDENSSRPLTGEKTIWYVCPQKDVTYWYRI